MSVAMLPPRQRENLRNQRTVVNCYSFFDRVFPACGFLDYTEGIYHGDPTLPHDEAQAVPHAPWRTL